MSEIEFEVKGIFNNGSSQKTFSKIVKANNEKHAKEITYCLFGSKHKCKRREINISEILKR